VIGLNMFLVPGIEKYFQSHVLVLQDCKVASESNVQTTFFYSSCIKFS
jgi:hypothetical protein